MSDYATKHDLTELERRLERHIEEKERDLDERIGNTRFMLFLAVLALTALLPAT